MIAARHCRQEALMIDLFPGFSTGELEEEPDAVAGEVIRHCGLR